mgnify:FL=1
MAHPEHKARPHTAQHPRMNPRPSLFFCGARRRPLKTLFALLIICMSGGVHAHGNEIIDLIANTRASVVGIGTTQPLRVPLNQLRGTGFAVGDGSLIVTNAHVVRDVLDVVNNERYVVFAGRGDDAKGIACTIEARDDIHDLALLKLKGGIRLKPLKVGDSDAVREGQHVAFTGFPIGTVLGLYPVTHEGMISAITPIAVRAGSSRELNAARVRRLGDPFPVFQLDATAYPGNSGSPVFDIDSGAVVGVINQVFVKGSRENVLTDPSDIAYAIPSKHLEKLLQKHP